MKIQKIILGILAILVLSSFVNADLSDYLIYQNTENITFDGTGTTYREIGNLTDYNNFPDYSGVTLESWIKPVNQSSDMSIIGRSDSTLDQRWFQLRVEDNLGARLLFYGDGMNSLLCEAHYSEKGILSDIKYNHIVATWDDINKNCSIYVNGVYLTGQQQTFNLNGSSWNSASEYTFMGGVDDGQTDHPHSLFYNGSINGVYIYNKTLTLEEIQARYAGYENISIDINSPNNLTNIINDTPYTLTFDINLTMPYNIADCILKQESTTLNTTTFTNPNNQLISYTYSSPIQILEEEFSVYCNDTSSNHTSYRTLNLTLGGMTFNATDKLTGTSINSFTISGGISGTTATGLYWSNKTNGGYSVNISSSGYVTESYNVTISNTSRTFQANLSKANTITINAFDTTGTPLENVTLTFNSETISKVVNTTNNTYYEVNATAGNYSLMVSKDNYSSNYYYFTLDNNAYITQEVYLMVDTLATQKTFYVTDSSGLIVEGARISFLEYINSSLKTFAQTETDYSGASVANLNSGVTYIVRVEHPSYLTKEVSLKPVLNAYTIAISGNIVNDYEPLFNDTSYYYYPQETSLYANQTKEYLFSVNDAGGSIEYFGINITYNGSVYTILEAGQPSGSVIRINVTTNETIPIGATLNATFYIKKSGYDLFMINRIYYIYPSITAGNTLASGTLKDDLSPLFRYIIISLSILIVVAMLAFFTSSLMVLSLSGLVVFGFFMYVEWISGLIGTLILIPTIILIILYGGRN